MFPATGPGGQRPDSQSQSDLRDLDEKRKALLDDLTDFEAMSKPLQHRDAGEAETDFLLSLEAMQGAASLDATTWFLAVYDKMQ